mgnify:FL=1
MSCSCPSLKSETEWLIKAGARFRVQITLRDKRTGKAFDLTDYTIKSHFRLNQYDYSLPAMWSASFEVTNAAKGKFILTLTPQTTKYMGGHGKGFFDIEIYSQTDATDIRRPLQGTWAVSLESTIE